MMAAGSSGELLTPRSWEVLSAVIDHHLAGGEPVGSRSVARSSTEQLCAATIRNVMVELEEMGLLEQPHSSAGRVPTDKAYRLYVNSMLRSPGRRPAPEAQRARIARGLAGTHGEIPAVMEEASRLLSHLSRQVGVVVAPDLSRVVFERIDFVRLEGSRILAVIVDPAGVVTHRQVDVAEEIPQGSLDRMARMLTGEFSGLTIPAARGRLIALMAEEKARYDDLMAHALSIAERLLDSHAAGDATVYLDGASNIVGRHDFSTTGEMRELFQAFEEKSRLVEILSRCMQSGGLTVRIGSENEDPRLRHCAVVAAPYGVPGRVLGTVGIIGPTRMEYARAIPLIQTLSRELGCVISQQQDGLP